MALFEKEIPSLKNVSIVDNVVKFLIDAIISGDLRPGDKLPSEVDFSQKFGVGRNAIREAIKVLVTYGILEVRSRAEGTYVCIGFSDNMLDPLVYGIILEQGSSDNIIELRRIIEVGTMQVAIQNATEDDINRLGEIYEELAKALIHDHPDPKDILYLDCMFHEQVERSVHNPLLMKISSMITKLTKFSRLQTIEILIKTNQKQYLIDTHYNLYNTIKERDLNRVSNVVEKSFQHWRIIVDKDARMQY